MRLSGSKGGRLAASELRVVFVGLLALFGWVSVSSTAWAQSPDAEWRTIPAPANWSEQVRDGRWWRVTPEEWDLLRAATATPDKTEAFNHPVLLKATYRATFDGADLRDGTIEGTFQSSTDQSGFVDLGRTDLAIEALKFGGQPAIHGVAPDGRWMLRVPAQAEPLTGQWSRRGQVRLGQPQFELTLPQALASEVELRVPKEWLVVGQGATLPATEVNGGPTDVLWRFSMGRQSNLRLRLERRTRETQTRLLVRESTSYSVAATDGLVRLRSDWDCLVDGGSRTALELAVPKTLRIDNVLLGAELPLRFERRLGSEEDRIYIPLQSLSGQRIKIQLLGEASRRADRAFLLPRVRPANGSLLQGAIRVAVDRPLQVLGVEAIGLRQTQLTEIDGQEVWDYEVNALDSRLSLTLGEPKPVPHARIRWIADLRGDSPVSLVHLRLSTREGEIFSPSLIIPPGWDLIRVEGARASIDSLVGWTVGAAVSGTGGTLASIELRQPIRADRDCELWLEMKSTRMPASGTRSLPVPAVRNVQRSTVEGVVWDEIPWEVTEETKDSVALTNESPSDELLKLVRWTQSTDSKAIATRITTDSPTPFQIPFRTEGSSPIDVALAPLDVRSLVPASGPLCVNVEQLTRTAPRDGRFHEHQTTLRFSRAVTSDGAPEIRLAEEGELTQITADGSDLSFVRNGSRLVLNTTSAPFSELQLHYRTEAHSGWVMARDEIVFPVPDCLVTEFAWSVQLSGARALYRMPMTAASSPQSTTSLRSRLLGPLARQADDSVFHPFSRDDWYELLNGSRRDRPIPRQEPIWLVAPRVPDQLTLKTWNRDLSNALAWCNLLACLTSGVALRRARLRWFSRTWIYAGGSWLVLALCLPEPYAPVAGGGFLGSVFAVLMPRRLAINPDWFRRATASVPIPATATWTTLVLLSVAAYTVAQEASPAVGVRESFEMIEPQTGETVRYIPSEAHTLLESLVTQADPHWLLRSSLYRWDSPVVSPTDQSPLLAGLFDVVVIGDRPVTPVKIPLAGISLQAVEGTIGTESVRLIPARDGQGVVVPLSRELLARLRLAQTPASPAADPAEEAAATIVPITIRFRPIPVPDAMGAYAATIPSIPESVLELPAGAWDVVDRWGGMSTSPARRAALGAVGRLSLDTTRRAIPVTQNVTSVEYRTLLEAGPLSTRVLIGIRAEVRESAWPAEFSIQLPPEMAVQSITGASVEQHGIEHKGKTARLRIRLRPGPLSPIEVIGVITNGLEAAFTGPVWQPTSPPATEPPVVNPGPIGVFATPGYTVAEVRSEALPPAIAPQAFVDSLIPGIAWRVPDLAWSTRPSVPVRWQLKSMVPRCTARMTQRIELDIPRARWHCEATIENPLGIPFEVRCQLDPRLQVSDVSIQQDGAERLLHWSRNGDQLQLWIRDGQPGTQNLVLEGELPAAYGAWTPPVFALTSCETVDSSVTVLPPPRGRITGGNIPPNEAPTVPVADSSEELHYEPGTPQAPTAIRIDPVSDELRARAWIDLVPVNDQLWQLHLRAQLIDAPRSASAVRVDWSQPGLEDVRPGEKRDQLRRTTNGTGFIWRPGAAKGSELSLRARFSPKDRSWSIPLPQLTSPQSRASQLRFSEVWVSLPKGSGHRPTRLSGQLQSALPATWPSGWSTTWTASRSLLFSGSADVIQVEPVSTAQLVRPVWSETMIWSSDPQAAPAGAVRGITQTLLIAEGDALLKLDDAALPHILAVAIDGRVVPRTQMLRIPFQSNDLSHEITLWWESPDGPASQSLLHSISFGAEAQYPQWVGVVPHNSQMLIGPSSLEDQTRFWSDRLSAMLGTAGAFPGAPWLVDGPLLRHMAESRQELKANAQLTAAQTEVVEDLDARWNAFLKLAGVATSVTGDAGPAWTPEGLHSSVALCGPTSSLWMSPLTPASPPPGPRVFSHRWSVALTAVIASVIALALLTWAVRLFRQYLIAEVIARHPHLTLASLGIVWWLGLTPSVLGLGMVAVAMVSAYLQRQHPEVAPLDGLPEASRSVHEC